MKHEQLNDEQLSLATGGAHGRDPRPHGQGRGTGGGDGLGWLRNLLRELFRK